MTETFAIKGGIGDFLQSLPFMMAHPDHRYLVASHHDRTSEFFAAVGLKVEEMLLGRLAGVEICPRQLFLEFNPFPRRAPPIFHDDGRPVIGVHLGGSSFSINIERRFGFPLKALPATVLNELVLSSGARYNFMLFGSPSELGDLQVYQCKNLRVAPNADITLSMPHVSECAALVGSDSAFKTMSAMLRIPTVVWCGDYMDRDRDDKFIDPYVRAGTMSVFRYKDLSCYDDEVSEGVDFCLAQLASTVGEARLYA